MMLNNLLQFVLPSPSDRDFSTSSVPLPPFPQSAVVPSVHHNVPIVPPSRLAIVAPTSAVFSPISSPNGFTFSPKSSSTSNSYDHSSFIEDSFLEEENNLGNGSTKSKLGEEKQRKIGTVVAPPEFVHRNFTSMAENGKGIIAFGLPTQHKSNNNLGDIENDNYNYYYTNDDHDHLQHRKHQRSRPFQISTTEEANWQIGGEAEPKDDSLPAFGPFASVAPQNAQISVITNKTKRHRWFDSGEAKNSVMCGLSLFYSMLVTIFALVLELSHLMVTNNSRRNLGFNDMLFGIYMYGCSILFLLYCYCALLLNPRWKRKIGKLLRKNAESSANIVNQCNSEQFQELRKVSHDGPSAGSLFLRLGCVVFGVIGTVYYAFNVFLCASDGTCPHYVIVLDIMAIAFVFVQMHFVFCNWKLAISDYQVICRFGTAHLIATNLWTWIRYILIEESLMGDEIRQVFARHATFPQPITTAQSQLIELSQPADGEGGGEFVNWDAPSAENAEHLSGANLDISVGGTGLLLGAGLTVKRSVRKCHGAECVLASFNEVMYTSIVEYSLIGTAVMFIVWKNIGQRQKKSEQKENKTTTAKGYVSRKHRIRMDCSKSTTGLFFGLAFLAGTFTSMSIFSGYTIMGQNRQAMMVFGSTDIIHYIIATIGCGIALWRMRLLRYHTHQQIAKPTDQCEMIGGAKQMGSDHRTMDDQQTQRNIVVPNVYSTNGVRRESDAHKTAIGTFERDDGTEKGADEGSGECAVGPVEAGKGKSNEGNQQFKSQELLDMILLAFGMTGEMIYSVAGLLGLTGSARTEERNWEQMTLILLTVHVTRILQVGLQSCLIYIAGKLRIGNDPILRERQPGKQAITFLLLANISMFLMNLLEAEKAGVSDTVVNFYGKRNWVFLVRSFSPLTIFYRFHSSVCLAEIWKSTYSWKE
ncbi:hypothetical protein niasHS_003246 [Heterodera schachtii]|uniref:Otopetrin n=1 Tax=Heterodera schachtii TaxID=97005 RepID=A0ABD2KFY1_HETSC